MALPTVIAKNQTGTPIDLPRLGLTAPASPGTIQLTDFATFFEVASEPVLETRVAAGDIVINDGTSDLSTAEALAYLNATGNMNGPTDSPAANALVKLSDASGRYTNTTGITVDGSDNVTGIGTLTATTLNGTNIQVGGSPLAWNDLSDVTLTSVAQGDVAYHNGTNWVNLGAGTSGHFLQTQGAGSNPQWASAAGGGATLQSAYDAGATIVTASATDIAFTLTSGGFVVNGAGAVDFGSTGTDVGGFAVGTSTFNIDATGAVTIDSTGGSIGIGTGADAQAINIGTGAAARTITVGNNTGATALNLTAGTGHTNTTTGVAWTGDISPTSLAANQNDYNPTGLSTAAVLRQDASAAVNVTGLQGGADGRFIVFHNISTTSQITLTNEDVSSTAANRFAFSGGDIVVPTGGSVLLQYDSTLSRWITVGGSPGLTGGRAWTHNVFTASSGSPYIRTTSGTYETIGNIGWPGTAVAGNPVAILATIRLSGGTSMDFRLFDVTNAAVICEILAFTTVTFTVQDVGTLANITTTAAIWEVQQLAIGGGSKADCAGLTIQY